MITKRFELQLLWWELNPEEPTHVEDLGGEEAKLLRDGVHCGTVRTTVLTKVSDLSVVFVQEKQNCGYLALILRCTTKKKPSATHGGTVLVQKKYEPLWHKVYIKV